MGYWCESAIFWIWEKVWKAVWYWAEKNIKLCINSGCDWWWCLCCNVWLCWLVIIVILVLAFVLALILEIVVLVVCFVIVIVCTVFCGIVSIFGADAQDCRDTCAGFNFTWDTSGADTDDDDLGSTEGGLTQNYSISGVVTLNGQGLPNVVMVGLPGNPMTDISGRYTSTVDSGWSGTVTPTLPEYMIQPPSRFYSGVTSDQTGQDYTAITSGPITH